MVVAVEEYRILQKTISHLMTKATGYAEEIKWLIVLSRIA